MDAKRRDRETMIEYLEAALALADKTSAVTTSYLSERALDEARAVTWPGNLDIPLPPTQ